MDGWRFGPLRWVALTMIVVSGLLLAGHHHADMARAAGAVTGPATAERPPLKLRRLRSGLRVGHRRVFGRQVLIPLDRRPPRGGAGSQARWVDKDGGDAGDNLDTDPGSGPGIDPPTEAPTTGTKAPVLFRGPGGGTSPGLPVVGATAAIIAKGNASQIAEPTVANDRNGSLVTGNWFAAISSDNGLTAPAERYINPFLWNFEPDTPKGDGFCCDQRTLSIRRGANRSMIAWVLMNVGDVRGLVPAPHQGSIRLVVFRGRDDVLSFDPAKPAVSTCSYVWRPTDLGLDANRWLDFPQMAATDEYLYLTANANKGNVNKEAVIWRVALDNLDDDCDAGIATVAVDTGHVFIAPVAGAGSEMFFGARHESLLHGDMIRIWRWKDSAVAPTFVDRDVNDYRQGGGAREFDCPVTGGAGDPCDGLDGFRPVGFRSGTTVGWLWDAKQDAPDKPYPYVRVATFSTGSLDLLDDGDIHSTTAAWAYPSVAVSEQGKVGLTLMRMGGSTFPEMHAYVVTDVTHGWPPGPSVRIASSDATPVDKAGGMGDYYSVQPFSHCPETFLASTEAMKGGGLPQHVEVGTAWFGEDGTGCPDLAMTGLPTFVTQSATLPSGLVGRSGKLSVTVTIQNIGAVGVGSTTQTAYYLSADERPGGDDIRLAGESTLADLPAGGTSTVTADVSVPPIGVAPGMYRVVACADDPGALHEVSNGNNCMVSSGFVQVTGTREPLDFDVRDVTATLRSARMSPGATLILSSRVGGPVRVRTATFAVVRTVVTLSPGAQSNGLERPLNVIRRVNGRSARGRTRLTRTDAMTVRLPRRLAAGTWYLRVCATAPASTFDSAPKNDCAASRPITVTR